MKKITVCIMAAIMSFTFMPTQGNATEATTITMNAEATKADALVNRLNEIKAMDRTNMTIAEKKEIRKEVRSIREQLKDIGGGVYISAGALILILILLIIFL